MQFQGNRRPRSSQRGYSEWQNLAASGERGALNGLARRSRVWMTRAFLCECFAGAICGVERNTPFINTKICLTMALRALLICCPVIRKSISSSNLRYRGVRGLYSDEVRNLPLFDPVRFRFVEPPSCNHRPEPTGPNRGVDTAGVPLPFSPCADKRVDMDGREPCVGNYHSVWHARYASFWKCSQ